MAKKHELKWNIEDLTDPDIYDAIRYLDPLPRSANERYSRSEDAQNYDSGVLSAWASLFCCLGAWRSCCCTGDVMHFLQGLNMSLIRG